MYLITFVFAMFRIRIDDIKTDELLHFIALLGAICYDYTLFAKLVLLKETAPEVIFFFMFNSTEHEILNAHKFKKYQEIHLFFRLR